MIVGYSFLPEFCDQQCLGGYLLFAVTQKLLVESVIT